MLKFLLKNLFSYKALFLLFFASNISHCLADSFNLKKIEIIGEQRLSESFIKKFVPNINVGIIDNQELNNLTKKLYMTGFFSNVELKIVENTLKITVKELAMINAVSFSGNDFLNDEQLNSIVSIAPREIFNKEILNLAIERIRSEYQKSGRYLAEVNVKKNDLSKGRINLNFEIKEGMPLVVKNINFSGNEVFSDSVLKSKLSTKEDAWYKLFGSNKFVPERLEFDKENLKTFYNQRGYIDFKVEIARGDLLPDLSGFNLNFVVSEGPRYLVNNINIQTKLIDKPYTSLYEGLFVKKGDYITSKDTLATTSYDIPLLVKSAVSKGIVNEIQSFQKADYLNENKAVGTGMFFYLDKSNRDNRNKVYYTFQPNKNFNFKYGDSIKLLLNNQEVYSCFKLEKKLLRVDSSIILYNKSKKKVKVVQSSKNFFYVNGLQDGDSILLNQD